MRIYNGFSNVLEMRVADQLDTPMDFVALGVTRMVLTIADVVVDSDASGDWDYTTRTDEGVVTVDVSGITFPVGDFGARLVVYYPARYLGVVVADGLPVKVA